MGLTISSIGAEPVNSLSRKENLDNQFLPIQEARQAITAHKAASSETIEQPVIVLSSKQLTETQPASASPKAASLETIEQPVSELSSGRQLAETQTVAASPKAATLETVEQPVTEPSSGKQLAETQTVAASPKAASTKAIEQPTPSEKQPSETQAVVASPKAVSMKAVEEQPILSEKQPSETQTAVASPKAVSMKAVEQPSEKEADLSLEEAFEQLMGVKYSQLAAPDVIDNWIFFFLRAALQGNAGVLKNKMSVLSSAHLQNQQAIISLAYILAQQKKHVQCTQLLLAEDKTAAENWDLAFDKTKEIETDLIQALTPDSTPAYVRWLSAKKAEEAFKKIIKERNQAYYHAGLEALRDEDYPTAHNAVLKIRDRQLSQDLGYKTDLALLTEGEYALEEKDLQWSEEVYLKIKNPRVKERLREAIDAFLYIEGMTALKNNDVSKARQLAPSLLNKELRDALWSKITNIYLSQ